MWLKKISINLLFSFVLSFGFYPSSGHTSPNTKALSGISCQTLLLNNDDFVLNADGNLVLFQLVETSWNLNNNPEFLAFTQLSPSEQNQEAQVILAKKHVNFTYKIESRWFGLFKKKQILIIPEPNGSELNETAYLLKSKFGVDLVYLPNELIHGTISYFSPAKKEICLSHASIFLGAVEISYFHEVRHAALSLRDIDEEASFYDAYVVTKYPKSSNLNYNQFLSLQEISTFFRDANYYYKAIMDIDIDKSPKFKSLGLVGHGLKLIELSERVLNLASEKISVAQDILYADKSATLTKQNDHLNYLVRLKNSEYEFKFRLAKESYSNSSNDTDLLYTHLNKMQKDITVKINKIHKMKTDLTRTLRRLNI